MSSSKYVENVSQQLNALFKASGQAQIIHGSHLRTYVFSKEFDYGELAEITDLYLNYLKCVDFSQRVMPPNPRRPIRHDKFICFSARIWTEIGDQLLARSNQAQTADEKRAAKDLLEGHGLDETATVFVENYSDASWDELLAGLRMLANNLQSFAQGGDDAIAGQTVKIDLPLYITAQLLRVISREMLRFRDYTTPDLI